MNRPGTAKRTIRQLHAALDDANHLIADTNKALRAARAAHRANLMAAADAWETDPDIVANFDPGIRDAFGHWLRDHAAAPPTPTAD